jgi:hypothetical protein
MKNHITLTFYGNWNGKLYFRTLPFFSSSAESQAGRQQRAPQYHPLYLASLFSALFATGHLQ